MITDALNIFLMVMIMQTHTAYKTYTSSQKFGFGRASGRVRTTDSSVARLCWIHKSLKPYHDDDEDFGVMFSFIFFVSVWSNLEVGPLEGLSERPAGRGGVNGLACIAVARDHLEGERLALHLAVPRKLPHFAPVSGHGLICVCVGALHIQLLNVTGAPNIGDEDEPEVRVSVDGVPNPSGLCACHPANQAINISFNQE